MEDQKVSEQDMQVEEEPQIDVEESKLQENEKEEEQVGEIED
jgi:hypothetical protein